MDLKKIIARRADLSTFIVHLTRAESLAGGRNNLRNIIVENTVEARTPYGSAIRLLEGCGLGGEEFIFCQKVVCFTETPLEYLHLFLDERQDDNAGNHFMPHGIAIPKLLARRQGVNPVWYLDMTPGHDWLTANLNNLIQEVLTPDDFVNSDIAKLAPFIEQMGTWNDDDRKEFWWEREWRHLGDFTLPLNIIGICPENEIEEFETFASQHDKTVKFIDPNWGLERIIAHLAGFSSNEISFFT